jgi:hypothetical protein
MSNAIKIQLLTAVAMSVAASPQHPSDMTGSVEGDSGFEITSPAGTVAWVTEAVYLATHQNFNALSCAQAIYLLNKGFSIASADWNTFFKHVKLGETYPELPPLSEIGDGKQSEYPPNMIEASSRAYFDVTTESGEVLHNWFPTHSDLQSSSWYVWTQEDADAELVEWEAAHPDRTYVR